MPHRRLIDIIAPNAKNISFCILLSLLLWYDIFLPQTEGISGIISTPVQSPLFSLIETFLPPGSLLGKITGLLLYLLLCFMLLRLNEVFSFIHVRTILPFLFCLISGGVLLRPHLLSPGIIVALLVLSSVFYSFKLLTKEEPKYAFNAALLLLTAALFSPSCVWLLVIFWLFAYGSNVLSFRVFLASLLGALTPALYAYVGSWIADIGFGIADSQYLLQAYMQESFKLSAVDFNFSPQKTAYLIFTGFLILLSLVDYMLVRSQENIKPRKEFSHIIMLFLATLGLIILSVPDSGTLLWLSIVFGSFLLGRFFSLKNNRFTKVLLFVYFGSSLLLLFYN